LGIPDATVTATKKPLSDVVPADERDQETQSPSDDDHVGLSLLWLRCGYFGSLWLILAHDKPQRTKPGGLGNPPGFLIFMVDDTGLEPVTPGM
jgi:hypothetical protein